MSEIRAADGTLVTDEMIESWGRDLDANRWPQGWVNVGEATDGPAKKEPAVTLSVKISAGMKQAISNKASQEGISVSQATRQLLAQALAN
ncbi:hypothetical protein [Propionimicrobium lymphophilum]|uniref:hypothetical protein n=1 Tax=Propionimicrobium lymphophilum TaxID=33012 RepID=UPI0003FAA5DD|nr:hypothetical protein [Propionimicrobium lymphophilum]